MALRIRMLRGHQKLLLATSLCAPASLAPPPGMSGRTLWLTVGGLAASTSNMPNGFSPANAAASMTCLPGRPSVSAVTGQSTIAGTCPTWNSATVAGCTGGNGRGVA
jgi:hypothetical protein